MKNRTRMLAFILILVIVTVNNPLMSFANSVVESNDEAVIISSTDSLKSEEIPCSLKRESLASEGFVKRVYEKEANMNQAVFENSDGTFTSYLFSENIKYYDKNGELRNKDNKLSLLPDGSYSNLNNEIVSQLPSELSLGVDIEYSDYKIKLTPLYDRLDSAEKLSLISSKDNENDCAVYKNAFGSNTILQYTPQYSGLKEDIIITQRIETNEFNFEVDTNGLSLVDDETGTYLTSNDSKEQIIDMGEIFINDSGGKYIIGDIKVLEVEKNQRYIMTIIVPKDFMDSADTIYPITVDPFYTIAQGGSPYFYDATIFSDYNVNDGNSSVLYVGNTDAWYGGPYRGTAETLMRFPVIYGENSGYFQQLCLFNYVLSAKIVLFDLEVSTAVTTINMYCNDSYWYEDTVIYSNGYNNTLNDQDFLDGFEKYSEYNYTVYPKHELDFTVAAYGWSNQNIIDAGVVLRANDDSVESMLIASTEHPNPNLRPYISYRFIDDNTISSGLLVGEEYYIMNILTGQYLGVANTSDTSGTNVIARDNYIEDHCQWIPQHISGTDRTYQLVSGCSSTGKVLGSTNYNVNIWQNFDDPLQKFEITRLYTYPYQGLYSIKWGDYYVAQDGYYSNVYLTTSFSKSVIWSIKAVDKGDADFFDFSYPEVFDTQIQQEFMQTLGMISFDTYVDVNYYPSIAYTYLSEYDDIFIFRGEGGPSYLQFSNSLGNVCGRLTVDDHNNNQPDWRYINNLEDNSLASLRCVLYLGSCTGLDDTSSYIPYNLVDETFIKGAHFVLGTTDIVYQSDVDEFLHGFLWAACIGRSIKDCIELGLMEAGEVYLPSSNTYGAFPIVYSGDTYQDLY